MADTDVIVFRTPRGSSWSKDALCSRQNRRRQTLHPILTLTRIQMTLRMPTVTLTPRMYQVDTLPAAEGAPRHPGNETTLGIVLVTRETEIVKTTETDVVHPLHHRGIVKMAGMVESERAGKRHEMSTVTVMEIEVALVMTGIAIAVVVNPHLIVAEISHLSGRKRGKGTRGDRALHLRVHRLLPRVTDVVHRLNPRAHLEGSGREARERIRILVAVEVVTTVDEMTRGRGTVGGRPPETSIVNPGGEGSSRILLGFLSKYICSEYMSQPHACSYFVVVL